MVAAATAVGSSALDVRHVSRRFPNGTEALADVSLSVAPGELVAIVGPSGCGKSTLLRLISGLDKPTSGTVELAPGNLGYVFQDATLLPWRTVRDNVELFAELHHLPAPERRAAADRAIALTGLSGFEHHHPRQLSGGMRMRVSLARSLTLRPSVFLFDEPFGSLDELTRERLNGELLDLFERERFAGVFVTHSIVEATFLATRVIVMSRRPGRLIAEFPVPFPYPRDPDLRYDPEFAAVAGAISGSLREAHA